MYGLENFSRSILFDEEFESALLFLKNAKAIFSVCDVITRKVYFSIFLTNSKRELASETYDVAGPLTTIVSCVLIVYAKRGLFLWFESSKCPAL